MKSVLIILVCVAVAHASSSSSGSGSLSSYASSGSSSGSSVSSYASSSSASSGSSVSSYASSSSAPSSVSSYVSSSSAPSSVSSYVSSSSAPSSSVLSYVSVYVSTSPAPPPLSVYVSTVVSTPVLISPLASSTLVDSVLATLYPVLASEPLLTTYLGYVEVLLAQFPSIQCADDTLEEDIRSHAVIVSEIECAISSPSQVSDPTYVQSLENKFPSVVTAYQQVYYFESAHPQFAYAQTLIESLASTHPTILSDISVLVQATSPSLYVAESVVYYAILSSPSLISYLQTVAQLDQVYPQLSSAEQEIAYYEQKSPSIVSIISEAVLSPVAVDSPLPAEYPILADAYLTIVSYLKTLPQTEFQLISEAVLSPSSVPSLQESEAHQLLGKFPTLVADFRVVSSYKASSPVIVSQIFQIEESPQILHEPAVVSNPSLAYACFVVQSYEHVKPASVIKAVSELEISPQVLKGSKENYAKSEASSYPSLAAAEKVIAKYKKINSKIVQQVNQQLSCSKVVHEHSVVMSHANLFSAFQQVASINQKHRGLSIAQASLDCAESSNSALITAYSKVSMAKHSMGGCFSHAINFVSSSNHFHQSAHQAHQSAHQSVHQSAHQSAHNAHQSAHSAHMSVHHH